MSRVSCCLLTMFLVQFSISDFMAVAHAVTVRWLAFIIWAHLTAWSAVYHSPTTKSISNEPLERDREGEIETERERWINLPRWMNHWMNYWMNHCQLESIEPRREFRLVHSHSLMDAANWPGQAVACRITSGSGKWQVAVASFSLLPVGSWMNRLQRRSHSATQELPRVPSCGSCGSAGIPQ